MGSLNEYILSALQEKNLIYFSFFLHHYEPQLNKRIKDFSVWMAAICMTQTDL